MEMERETVNKLFVGSIPEVVTEKELKEHFARLGSVTDLVIIRDKHTKKSRGFGFVSFKDKRSAKRALKEKHEVRDCPIEVKLAEPKKASKLQEVTDVSTITKVFIGGIPKTARQEDLLNWFSQYGEIEEADLIEDKKTNEQRGFGFVTFKQRESVKKVLEEYSKHKILGKWVECKVALPKSVSEPTTNANFTLDDNSSDLDVVMEPEIKLPRLKQDKNPVTVQASSSPQIILMSGHQSRKKEEPRSQVGIDKPRKKQPKLNKVSRPRNNFDFGDLCEDQEEEGEELYFHQVCLDFQPASLQPEHYQTSLLKRSQNQGERQTAEIAFSSLKNRETKKIFKRGYERKISRWIERGFDQEFNRHMEYRFTKVTYQLGSLNLGFKHPLISSLKGINSPNSANQEAGSYFKINMKPVCTPENDVYGIQASDLGARHFGEDYEQKDMDSSQRLTHNREELNHNNQQDYASTPVEEIFATDQPNMTSERLLQWSSNHEQPGVSLKLRRNDASEFHKLAQESYRHRGQQQFLRPSKCSKAKDVMNRLSDQVSTSLNHPSRVFPESQGHIGLGSSTNRHQFGYNLMDKSQINHNRTNLNKSHTYIAK